MPQLQSVLRAPRVNRVVGDEAQLLTPVHDLMSGESTRYVNRSGKRTLPETESGNALRQA